MKLLFVALVISGYLHFGYCGPKPPLHVTLEVFSGLPDPQWTINPANPNYQKIQKLFNEAGNQGFAFLPEQMPAQLGYTGFLVREEGQESAVLILGPQTKELQQNLLKTVPTGKQIPKDLINEIGKMIEGGKVLPVDIETSRTKRVLSKLKKAFKVYFKWNNWYRRPRNNCYNYANDMPTNTFAQPGRGSEQPPITSATLTADVVRNYAKSDGLKELVTGPGGPIPKVTDPNQHLVALVVATGLNGDFHWYRQDSNGLWSHKRGKTKVTNLDESDNPINDPRTADKRGYKFVCFMTTDKNNVNIE